MLRIPPHRVIAATAILAAAILAAGALASATSPLAASAAGAAPATPDAPTTAPGAEALVARLGAAVELLGKSLARDAAATQPLPEGTPAVTPAPLQAERGARLDATPHGLPAALDLDLGLGVATPAGPSVEEARVASASTAPAAPVVLLEPLALGLSAALLALLGALAWFWPTVKEVLARVVLAPLYAHITRDEVFENGVREALFNLVKAEPGISASELAARNGVSWGTTIYHLDVLEQNRMVVSVRDGRYRRYFENGAATAAGREAVSVLRNAQSAAVADRVSSTPGLTQKDLARATGLSPQALHWHAERLLKAGVVTKVREGRVVRFFPQQG